jgi:hypothetical protein
MTNAARGQERQPEVFRPLQRGDSNNFTLQLDNYWYKTRSYSTLEIDPEV